MMHVHPMWDSYPMLKKDLQKVMNLINQNILIRDKNIEKIIRDTASAGGKMLRPAYSLLTSYIGPERDEDRAAAIAAAIECIHMATLIHDDVIDEADTRHGREALHRTSGNKFAIYAGDYMISLSMSLLSRHASSFTELDVTVRRIQRILIGELEQLHSRYLISPSVKNYLSRISGKTAELFAISCYSGAVGSKAPNSLAKRALNMGRYIGMAFQIMDDVLDYKSDEETLGKPVMNDVRQGVYTLPLIYAIREKGNELKSLLNKKEQLTDEDLAKVLAMIRETGGIEKSKNLAKRYTEKAIKEMHKLPDGDYKNTIYTLTRFLLEREM